MLPFLTWSLSTAGNAHNKKPDSTIHILIFPFKAALIDYKWPLGSDLWGFGRFFFEVETIIEIKTPAPSITATTSRGYGRNISVMISPCRTRWDPICPIGTQFQPQMEAYYYGCCMSFSDPLALWYPKHQLVPAYETCTNVMWSCTLTLCGSSYSQLEKYPRVPRIQTTPGHLPHDSSDDPFPCTASLTIFIVAFTRRLSSFICPLSPPIRALSLTSPLLDNVTQPANSEYIDRSLLTGAWSIILITELIKPSSNKRQYLLCDNTFPHNSLQANSSWFCDQLRRHITSRKAGSQTRLSSILFDTLIGLAPMKPRVWLLYERLLLGRRWSQDGQQFGIR